MKVFRALVGLALSVGVAMASAASASAQTPTPPATPQAQTPPPAPGQEPVGPQPDDFERFTYARPVVRVGSPLNLGQNAAVRDAVVIMADATIAGRVLGDVVVVLGNLRFEPTAVVEGSVVVVGGVATVMPGATLDHDFAIIGGALEAPPGFTPRGEHVLVGPPELGQALREITPWFTRGLLWGRMIVPGLSWVWTILAIVLLINVVIALAFPGAVSAAANTLATRPLATAVVGMLSLLLFAPIVTILAISVVGIIVIPFVSCALFIAWMVGKVSVAQWIGARVIRQDDPENRAQVVRSMLIGFVLLCLLYMVPLIGLAAWAMVGVLGLGAATLTAMAGLKRERPAPPPQPVIPPAPPGSGPSSSGGVGGPGEPAPAFAPMASAAAGGAGSLGTSSSAGAEPAAASVPVSPPVFNAPAGGAAAVAAGDLLACPKANFLDRLVAAVLDFFLVAIAYNLLDFNLWRHESNMFFLMLIAYHIVFWAWKGTTVGGIVCSLRIVKTNGATLQPADAVVRALSGLFSIAALGIGFLWILRDPERQSWHDRIAGTYVVSVPRHWPLP
jgi:uncharacterized RDD family membrane protein YckC